MRNTVKIIITSFIVIGISQSISAQNSALKLGQCIDTAMANSITLLLDINTIELNRLGLKQSKNNLLPTINGSFTEDLSAGRMVNPITDLYETGTVWATEPGLTLSQNLFDGLQYLNGIKQNALTYKSSKLDLENDKFNITVSVVNAFLQVLYAKEAIKIAQQQVGFDSTNLQVTKDMQYVGKATESAVLQSEAQLRSDQFTVVNDQSAWKLAKVNLEQLMNIAISETFDIDYTALVEPRLKSLEDINSVYSQSLVSQPIIKSYALKTQSALFALKVAKGAYYPQLMFKASAATDYSSIATQNTTTTTNNLEKIGYLQGNPSQIVVGNVPQESITQSPYSFGNQFYNNLDATFSVGLSIPILNYLQARNNVKKQEVNLNIAQLNEQNTHLTLRKTIEQIYTNVENSNAQYQSAMEEVESTKAAYDISVATFEQGKEIITTLLTQKNAYVKGLSDYLQAKYGLLFNMMILDYYKGVPVTF